MEGNWFENEIEKLKNFGVSAPISQRIKEQLDFEARSRRFQKMLRNASDKIKQKVQFDCPVCKKPMQKNISLTTDKIYWFCKCFGHSFDTLELIRIINRKARKEKEGK